MRVITRDDIIKEVNEMLKSDEGSIQWEDYITFWIAQRKDHDTATELFNLFLTTCKTTYEPDVYPAMVGACASGNLDILDLIKGYVKESDMHDEMRNYF